MKNNSLKYKFLKHTDAYLCNNNIDLNGETVALALSGGVDSMVLLDVLLSLKEKYSFKLIVCHVNHKRRKESEDEEAYIKEYLKDKCEICILHFKENEGNNNFQEYARLKRYAFFEECLKKEGGKYLFLAHHLNDDMETTIMKMLRASSLDGISGMKEVSNYKGLILLRPFLDILKSDIYEYANENGLVYFEDESNSHDDYERNRIRHNIIPELFKENPSVHENFKDIKARLAYASALVSEKRDQEIEGNVQISDSKIEFEYRWFNKLDDVLKIEVLFELLKGFDLSLENVKALIDIITCNKKSFENSYKGIKVVKDSLKVELILDGNTEDDSINDAFEMKITEEGIYNIDDKRAIEFKIVSDKEARELKNRIQSENNLNNLCITCYNSMYFPFVIRKRKANDKILLSKGHKKIKDLYIDLRLSAKEKNSTLLLIDKDGDIISALGMKKSEKINNIDQYDLIITYKSK